MTLIVLLATRDFIVQVTDRLVTRGPRPFDQLANKNLVYGARNAVVSIAYTGAAYIENIPTDQWIAEKLSGVTYTRNERPAAFRLGGNDLRPGLDLGMSMIRLRVELQKYSFSLQGLPQKEWEAKNFVICITGFLWNKKGHWRPVVALVHKPLGGLQCHIWQMERNWHLERDHQIAWVPRENLTTVEKKNLIERIYDCEIAQEVDRSIAEGIQDVAKRNTVVGPNCMGIFIDSPTRAEVRVRYLPAEPTRATIPYDPKQNEKAVVYSPWVVGAQNIVAPSAIGGAGWNVPIGHYTVHLRGNEKEGEMPEGLHIRGHPRKPLR